MHVDIWMENDDYYFTLVDSEKQFFEELSGAKPKGFLRINNSRDEPVWININKISSFKINN